MDLGGVTPPIIRLIININNSLGVTEAEMNEMKQDNVIL